MSRRLPARDGDRGRGWHLRGGDLPNFFQTAAGDTITSTNNRGARIRGRLVPVEAAEGRTTNAPPIHARLLGRTELFAGDRRAVNLATIARNEAVQLFTERVAA